MKKRYFTITRFGITKSESYSIKALLEEGPFIEFRSLKQKLEYDSLISYINREKKNGFNDQRVTFRFVLWVWYKYVYKAIREMIVNNERIPITDKGLFIAVGHNKLAATKKGYKFNPKTMGVEYMPVFIWPKRKIRMIKYPYRVRFYKYILVKYKEELTGGKVYEKQPTDERLEKVNQFYEQRFINLIGKTGRKLKKKPYAVRL